MTTIKRLRRLTGEATKPGADSNRADEISELRRRIDEIVSRRPVAREMSAPRPHTHNIALHDVIRGEEVANKCGKFFIVRGQHTASAIHGNRRLKDISAIDMKAAALLANDTDIASFACHDALFLDTETTGLAGGTGTFAFLIGVGWFDNEAFITQQIFARDFSEERAGLSFLLEIARGKKFLVTYNGKIFDIGILSTRFILNRLPDALAPMPHLDLLHPARRLFGHRLENNRLSTMERDIIEFQRYGDIPGSEIPQRYFDWLRYRDPHLLTDVFEHNRLDVVSMAALSIHLAELVDPRIDRHARRHTDLLAASRLFLDRGDHDRAQRILESLVDSNEPHVALEAKRSLSLIYKRHGRWAEAAYLWKAILQHEPGNLFAVEELAKNLEHRERNFTQAIDLINQTLGQSNFRTGAERDALLYRLRRLQGRAGRSPKE
ncbi:MAG TPA: ribonuclease H-like domain-containing protein [Syntrophales bacterium]|nr:ribonuclease H-like domain-containing protein [Syntrophales bacterium]